jgi:AAA domain
MSQTHRVLSVHDAVEVLAEAGARVPELEALVPNGDSPPKMSPPGEYHLEPLDWPSLIESGIPPTDYLVGPYIIRGARTWLWGPTGTAKSIYALWVCRQLSARGIRIAYFSEENPTEEDLRRLSLLRPDPALFTFFHRTGIDLTDPRWVAAMLEATKGCGAVAFDTWTDCWHGDESSNEEVRDFDADVLKPMQAQGTTPIVVHHTGHPQMFSNRRGATAGRGASSLGQKADVALEFRAEDDGAFTVVYGKARIGGVRQPERTFRVVDVEGGIDILEIGSSRARTITELAERAVSAVLTAPRRYLTTSELRAAVGGARDVQAEALELAEGDERIRVTVRRVQTKDGRHRDAKVWEPVEGGGGMFE